MTSIILLVVNQAQLCPPSALFFFFFLDPEVTIFTYLDKVIDLIGYCQIVSNQRTLHLGNHFTHIFKKKKYPFKPSIKMENLTLKLVVVWSEYFRCW